MTLAENRRPRASHAADFAARPAFTYTVLAPGTNRRRLRVHLPERKAGHRRPRPLKGSCGRRHARPGPDRAVARGSRRWPFGESTTRRGPASSEGRSAREALPVDPAGAVPPAVPGRPSRPGAQTSIRSALHDEAAGSPVSSPPSVSHGCHDDAVPVAVPQLAVGKDREDLELIDGPRGGGRCRGERPAERFGLVPCAGSRNALMDRAPSASTQNRSIRSAPHETAAVPSMSVWCLPSEEATPQGASARPRSSATHSSSRTDGGR